MPASPSSRTRRWPALVLAVVILFAGLTAALRGPQDPRPASAPPEVFSAERAKVAAAPVVVGPRVTGTAANADARAELVRQLTAQGWQVRVESGVGRFESRWQGPEGAATGGYVQNIVAVRPGQDPTGTLVLATHHDSVPGSPGGGDDGIGVAVLLETGRLLAAAEHRNDVVLLLTDGEEAGLLGAQAFLEAGAGELRAPVAVVNHEARGNSGMPIVTRTQGDVRGMVRAGGTREVESYADVMFGLSPTDTDFSRWRDAGWVGLDVAVVGDAEVYHTPLDTLAALDPAALQAMGEVTARASVHLADADLSTLDAASPGAFTAAPWGMVTIPRWLPAPLAGAALLLVVVCALRARARGRLSARGLLAGVLSWLVTVAVALVLGALIWPAARAVDASRASVVVGEPPLGWPYIAAELAVAVAAVLTVVVLGRRRPGPGALGHAALLLQAVLVLAGAVLEPDLVVVLVVPLFGAAVAVGLSSGSAAEPDGAARARWPAPAVGVCLLPVAWFWGTQLPAVFDLGAASSFGFAGAQGLLGLLFLTALLTWVPRAATGRPRRPSARWVGVVLGCWLLPVTLTLLGLQLNDADPQPRQELVGYEVTDGHGRWTGTERTPWARDLPEGPSPAAPPRVEVLADSTRDGIRVLDLRVSSPRGGHSVELEVDGDRRPLLVTARLEDLELPVREATTRVRIAGLPTRGARVRLEIADADQLTLTVTDHSDDLTQAPGWSDPPEGWVVVNPRLSVATVREL